VRTSVRSLEALVALRKYSWDAEAKVANLQKRLEAVEELLQRAQARVAHLEKVIERLV